MREYGSQAVVWQTAINPIVALELLDEGVWSGAGVLGPEAFAPKPFLDRIADIGAPHGVVELSTGAAAHGAANGAAPGAAAAS
jgi:saccharopine dehydrogenase-like NADP-dependent oxidoreductase